MEHENFVFDLGLYTKSATHSLMLKET